jgi:MFS transporter, DHA2 family, multidrug resistance protein
VVFTYLAQRTQANHAELAGFLTAFSLPLQQAVQQGVYDLATPQGLAVLNAEATRQASLLAYLQDFRLMMWISLSALPLLALLRGPAPRR